MVETSHDYRLRAVAAEQRAKEALNPIIRKELEELATQWHLIAHLVAQMSGGPAQNDIV